MSLNLAEIFYQRATTQPEHPVILGPHEETCITYGAFQRDIQHLAEHLHQAGIRKGMNIGLHYPSGQAYIAFTYALWANGAAVTPIPVELATEEKQQILHHIAIDAVISAVRLSDEFITPFVIGEATLLTEQASLFTVKTLREPPPELAELNPAFIRFTSGTTGEAKGVVLSHETIFERIQAANQGLHIGPADRIVWLLSMAYHFAVSIVAYLTFGATIILPKNAFGVSILQAAHRHQATLIYGAPTHYELMTHDRSGQTLPPLRLAIVTTARLSTELADTFYQRFGLPLNETYGIIEIGLPAVNLEQPRAKQGSVGKLLPDYTIKLVQQPDEAAREILLNGPGLLDAYYDPWQPRAEILQRHNDWLATGDLGVMDDAGFLTIVGRSKEMISVAGMKFFSQEVETVLERHPAIRAACVFGVKAPRLGETPRAHLVLADRNEPPTETALKNYCTEHLASYKIPSQFHWVNRLARTASGKLIRNADKLLNTNK
jgi:long-chain acyl-CoA synthetase